MQITISQQSLSRELSLLAGAADKKSSIPILGTVLIEADGNKASLTATDLEISLQTSIDCNATRSGTAAIPIDRLKPFISGLPIGDVSISIGANGHATVSAGKSKGAHTGRVVGRIP
jgi:DNA polymerase-3 subunit beta